MPETPDYVRVPRAMYEQLEKRAARATELEVAIATAGNAILNYEVTAVITRPPSGTEFSVVLSAVQRLVEVAKEVRRG